MAPLHGQQPLAGDPFGEERPRRRLGNTPPSIPMPAPPLDESPAEGTPAWPVEKRARPPAQTSPGMEFVDSKGRRRGKIPAWLLEKALYFIVGGGLAGGGAAALLPGHKEAVAVEPPAVVVEAKRIDTIENELKLLATQVNGHIANEGETMKRIDKRLESINEYLLNHK